jgi:hypothetical protein
MYAAADTVALTGASGLGLLFSYEQEAAMGGSRNAQAYQDRFQHSIDAYERPLNAAWGAARWRRRGGIGCLPGYRSRR